MVRMPEIEEYWMAVAGQKVGREDQDFLIGS